MDDKKDTLRSLLDQMQQQNKADMLFRTLELKNKQIGTEDASKQQKLLDKANESLEKIEKAVIGNNEQIKVLPKNIASQLNSKLSDLIVKEDDKTSTEKLKELVGGFKKGFQTLEQGINNSFNSGFKFLSDPLGSIKEGLKNVAAKGKERVIEAKDYVKDVASTKAGYTAEEGRFVEEFKKQNKTSSFGVSKEEEKQLVEKGTAGFRQTKDLEEKIKVAESSIQKSKKLGFEAAPEDAQKLEELKKLKSEVDVRGEGAFTDSVKEIKPVPEEKLKEVQAKQNKNEEADNVVSAQESIADSFKENNELIKELLTTTKDQLDSVKAIKDSLVPKETTDDQDSIRQKKEKFYGDVTTKLDEISGKLDNVGSGGGSGLLDAATSLLDMGGRGGKAVPGKPASKAGGIASKMSKLGTAAKVGGAVVAVAGGAYTAYEGYSAAEDSKQAKMEDIQARLDSGEINPKQAAAERKEAGNTATIEKSGAIGEGTGMAAGGIAGLKVGAALGSFAGPVGTVVGGLAGGAIGAFAGSSLGKKAGELGGSVLNYFKGDKKQEVNTTASTVPNTKQPLPEKQKNDVVAKMDNSQAGVMQTVGAASKDPQMAKDIEEHGRRTAETPVAKVNPPSPLSNLSVEYNDQTRAAAQNKPTPAPIVMNSSSSNNSTSFVPIKPSPRSDSNGSPLERYQSRITTY